jgi:hypothetical protein
MKCKHEWRLIMNVSDGEYYYCKYCLARAVIHDYESKRNVSVTEAKWNTK